MYQSAYFVGNLFLAVFWLALFFRRKDLRKEQLFVSTIGAVFGPVTDYFIFYKDYWRPQYLFPININGITLGIESPLCGFLIGGIAAVLYESFFRKKQKFSKPRNVLALVITLAVLFTMIFLSNLGMNSIWASIISLVGWSIVMIIIDKNL